MVYIKVEKKMAKYKRLGYALVAMVFCGMVLPINVFAIDASEVVPMPPETGTVTVMGASAMGASLITAIVVGVVAAIFSFIVLVRRIRTRKED